MTQAKDTERPTGNQPSRGLAETIRQELRLKRRAAMSVALDQLEEEIERRYPHGHYRELLDPNNDWCFQMEINDDHRE